MIATELDAIQTVQRSAANALWHAPAGTVAGQQGSHTILSRQVARCLRYVAEHPGSSSVEVQHGVGIRHPSQVSRVLAGLERDRLVRTVRDRRSLNAWQITARGGAVLAELPEAIYE